MRAEGPHPYSICFLTRRRSSGKSDCALLPAGVPPTGKAASSAIGPRLAPLLSRPRLLGPLLLVVDPPSRAVPLPRHRRRGGRGEGAGGRLGVSPSAGRGSEGAGGRAGGRGRAGGLGVSGIASLPHRSFCDGFSGGHSPAYKGRVYCWLLRARLCFNPRRQISRLATIWGGGQGRGEGERCSCS
jgi:hypothetical protein